VDEYRCLNNYFKTCRTQHHLSYPYTEKQMDSVENHHCQIVEMGLTLTLIAHSHLPKPY
jgi:hypothetical protein